MPTPTACPLCNAPLEPGFLLDRADGNRGEFATWIAGTPVSGFFGLKYRFQRQHPVTALRCTSCDHLLLFAPRDPNS